MYIYIYIWPRAKTTVEHFIARSSGTWFLDFKTEPKYWFFTQRILSAHSRGANRRKSPKVLVFHTAHTPSAKPKKILFRNWSKFWSKKITHTGCRKIFRIPL